MKWEVIVLVAVLFFSVSSVMADQRDIDDYFEQARGELLGFYNSEIVAHAGQILGSFVASATLLSSWERFLGKDKTSWKRILKGAIFFFTTCLTIGLVIYSFGRLIYWSGLDAFVIGATPEGVTTYFKANITTSNVTSWVALLHNYTMYRFGNVQPSAIEPQYGIAQYFSVQVLFILVIVLTPILLLIWWITREKEDQESKKPSLTLEKRKWYTQLHQLEVLTLEYQELTKAIWNRGHHRLILQSILISGSLLAVSYVARNISEMNVLIARIVLCGSLSMIAVAYVFHYTTERVNSVFWQRVNKLEELIGIEVGNRGIYNEIKDEKWFKLRRYVWNCIFVLLAIFYVIALIWTFY